MDTSKRERAAIYVAAFIVFAYSSVGFVHVAIVLVKGNGVVFPSDWLASMLTLASAATGFLLGVKTTDKTPVPVTTEGTDPLKVEPVKSPQGSNVTPPVASAPPSRPPIR